MTLSVNAIRKVGDIFTDFGKYVLTVVPVTYVVSLATEISYLMLFCMGVIGFMLCFIGVYLIHSADKWEENMKEQKGNQHKIKLMRNTVIYVEEVK